MNNLHGWSLFQNKNFTMFLASRFCASLASMMLGVAIGWQVYAMTRSTFALGMVGLAQFLPALAFALPGGLVADKIDRRLIILTVLGGELLATAALLFLSVSSYGSVYPIFAVLVLLGAGRSFVAPASQSLLPFIVTAEEFPRAVAWHSTAFQCATIVGPAMGGFIYAAGPSWVYGTASLLLMGAVLFAFLMQGQWKIHGASVGLQDIFTGVTFVFAHKNILGAISLDLFAVLFGGATALLPVFATEILHTGPWGLGLLRSAPAAGAALVALWLTHHPIARNTGKKMFCCVALFGLSTIAFALSTNFFLSAFFLSVLGGADMISVVIRQTLVQISTPNAMRGRVSAVNAIFIGASNELGEFESGVTASLFGTVPAAVLGGIGTLIVVALWVWLFPSLRKVDTLKHEQVG